MNKRLLIMLEKKDPLEDELMHYEDKWVAILETERRVVGSGETAYEAKRDAEAKGFEETALFKVQPSGKYYVLASVFCPRSS